MPGKYIDAIKQVSPEAYQKKVLPTPPLYDLDARFRIMDRFEGVKQVLSLAFPAPEEIAAPDQAPGLARLANDEMAELVLRFPDRFVTAIASLPMNNGEAALRETDRAIGDLKFKGVQIFSNINGQALDSDEFLPLFEKMARYDLPIYIHPERTADFADYRAENSSKYLIYAILGWPYETAVAMTRLVFSGIFERFPNLKIVTHHCSGMIPFLEQRIVQHYDKIEQIWRKETAGKPPLTKPPIDYFKMFYNDTAIHGNTPALMCAHAFCGAEHLLFAADMPLGDREFGSQSYQKTIRAIDQMGIRDDERECIFAGNIRKLMHLPA